MQATPRRPIANGEGGRKSCAHPVYVRRCSTIFILSLEKKTIMANRSIPMHVLKLRGTARADRHGDRGIHGKPTSRAPPVPNWLPEDARTIWRKLSKEMVLEETWRSVFEFTLAAYCVLYAEFKAQPRGFNASKLTQMRLLGCPSSNKWHKRSVWLK